MIWSIFKKARHLSEKLAESLIDDQLSHPELTQWREESAAGKKTWERFARPDLRLRMLSQFEQSGKEKAVRQFQKTLRKHKRIQLFRQMAAAAAIAFLLISSTIFLYSVLDVPKSPEQAAEIWPGSQQAVLILDSGEKINLSDITQIHETDGTAIRKKNPGEIVYNGAASRPETKRYNTVIVPRYGEYAVILSDGTRIKLNSESELRYPTVFSGSQREVFLKGEAYLEVSKSQRPFIVHTYDAHIKVYGTRFNVNSYLPEQISVVLVEGKVSVSSGHSREVFLDPRQLARIDRRNGISIKKGINTAYYTAWQNGYFAFEAERLEDILNTLARWYSFDVLYSRPQLKDIRFTASLNREQPLKDILQQFQKTGCLSYRISGRQIIIQ